MAKKVFFVLLASMILISGLAFANQPNRDVAKEVNQNDESAKAVRVDEAYAIRSGELQKWDAEPRTWSWSNGAKQFVYDTLLAFGGEGPSWNDEMTGTPWDTVDMTVEWTEVMWHRDDFNAINGTHSMWCGDSTIGPNGGYLNDRYQLLITPQLILTADNDSLFLIYKQKVRCEEAHGVGIFEGWDGYNVRVDVPGDDTGFVEIAPYKVAYDSSYYQHPPTHPVQRHEWNILRCWERHGLMSPTAYLAPWDQWIGGYADDGTVNPLNISTKIYDLRPFAGDTIQIAFTFGSDWGYNTMDDSTLFGVILDDILIVDDMDATTLSTLPTPLGGDTLLFDDFEAAKGLVAWEYQTKSTTGNWWWLANGGQSGLTKMQCSDDFSNEYPKDADNAMVSPKIANADLDDHLAGLKLFWYLKCGVDPDHAFAYNQYKLDDGEWENISVLTHPTNRSYVYGLDGVSNTTWWNTDQWSDYMTNLTPLVIDSAINASWDTLQIAVGFSSDEGDPSGYYGLQVDDIVLSGRIADDYDVGMRSLKVHGPNANDLQVTLDSAVVANWGFNPASAGNYQIYMSIVDTGGAVVWGPNQVQSFPGEDLYELEEAMLPIEAQFTLQAEGSYDIVMWTNWPADEATWNDTLRIEYDDGLKALAWHYPGFFNYPAGQGQLRYHDQGLYNYPYVNIQPRDSLDITAVHFTPDASLYPFDIRLGLPELVHVGQTYDFYVWGSGSSEPGTELYKTSFTTANAGSLDYFRIELDTIDVLQHMSSDFWMGVGYPIGTADSNVTVLEIAENDLILGRDWGHSYLYTDADGWAQYDNDYIITAVIAWRTIDAASAPSLSGPPKNDSGNLYLYWDAVSEAKDYLIYRGTNIDSTFPFLDSTDVANYTDVDAVGDPDTNYFYLFNTRHQDGGVYDKTSAAIGEFDRDTDN